MKRFRPAAYLWLSLILAVLGFETYAVVTHAGGTATLSEWIWMADERWAWFRYVVLAAVALLMLHFFGPRVFRFYGDDNG